LFGSNVSNLWLYLKWVKNFVIAEKTLFFMHWSFTCCFVTNTVHTVYEKVNTTFPHKANYKYMSKDVSFLHTTILTMCTAKKVNLKLEAKAPLRCRLS
jgi:hypothetical protein